MNRSRTEVHEWEKNPRILIYPMIFRLVPVKLPQNFRQLVAATEALDSYKHGGLQGNLL